MREWQTRWFFVALALLASGCLLPQPDTPFVPPGVMTGAPTSPGSPINKPEMATPAAGSDAELIAASLEGRVEGVTATMITALNAGSGASASSPIAGDGAFSLLLAPGRYWLDLTIDGRVSRVGQAIAVADGERRTITLKVAGDRVTIAEQAPLLGASPTP